MAVPTLDPLLDDQDQAQDQAPAPPDRFKRIQPSAVLDADPTPPSRFAQVPPPARFSPVQPQSQPQSGQQLPNGTVGAAPEPGYFDQLKENVRNSAVGRMFGMEPTLHEGPEATAARHSLPDVAPAWAKKPLAGNAPPNPLTAGMNAIDQQAAQQFRKAHPVAGGVVEGVQDVAQGLSTPENIALMMAAPESKILTGFFATQAAKGSYDSAQAAHDAFVRGDNEEAARYATDAGLNALVAGIAGYHATRMQGGIGYNPRYGVVLPPERPMLPAGPKPPVEMPPEQPALSGGPQARPMLPASTAGPSPSVAPPPPVDEASARTRIVPAQPTPRPAAVPDRGVVVAPNGQALRGAPALPAPPPRFKPVGAQPVSQPAPPAAPAPQGVGAVPTRPIIQGTDNPDALRASAERQQPVMEKATEIATQGVPGAEVEGMRVKEPDSIANKEERGKPVETTADVLGARVSAPADQVPAVEKNIEQKLPVVAKDTIDSNGLDVTQYQVRTGTPGEPNQVSEIQVSTPEKFMAMNETEDLYEKQKQALARGDREQAAILGNRIKAKMDAAEPPKLPDVIPVGTRVAQGAKQGQVVFFDKRLKRARVKFDDGTMAWSVKARDLEPAAIESNNGEQVGKGGGDVEAATPGKPPARFEPVTTENHVPSHPEATGDRWIGVDLDKTLAHYDTFKGKDVIGAPIPAMVDRVKQWVAQGNNVKILTARVSDDRSGQTKKAIQDWAETHIGTRLPVTDKKDQHMVALYDDRAVPVEANTGKLLAQPQPQEEQGGPQPSVSSQPHAIAGRAGGGEEKHAVQEPSAAGVLQREPGETGTPGSERGRVEPVQQGNEPAGAGAPAKEALEPKETKFKYGSTQANIPADSPAARALQVAREKIAPEDRAGTAYGGEVNGSHEGLETEPHVTVRYGIQSDDIEGIKKYLAQQAPFEATLGPTAAFPASEHSDGLVPIVAPVEAPQLHAIEKEIEQHGDFKERSFPEYKPHATLGYVKPEAADKYTGMRDTEGAKFPVNSISISDRQGNQTEVKLAGDRRKTPQPAGQPRERRTNAAERKRVAEMTLGEMRKEMLTNQKTGLPNRRAFDEDQQQHGGAVAMADVDGLKALNDKFGYEAGDSLLQAAADAMKEAGLTTYHDKGDEFLFRGVRPETMGPLLEKAREILRATPITATVDGKPTQFKGADFSYGTGSDVPAAETALKQHKSEREARGERARGELRGITPVGSEAGEERAGGETKPAKRTFPAKRPVTKTAVHPERSEPAAGDVRGETEGGAPEERQAKLTQQNIDNYRSAIKVPLEENLAQMQQRVEEWHGTTVVEADAHTFVALDKMARRESSSAGLTITSKFAKKLATTFRAAARIAEEGGLSAQQKGLEQLAALFQNTRTRPGGNLILFLKGVPADYREQLLQHDVFHDWQDQNLAGREQEIHEALNTRQDAVGGRYRVASRALRAMGYSANAVPVEMPAWIVGGTWADVGLTKEGGKQVLDAYLGEASKLAGSEILESLPPNPWNQAEESEHGQTAAGNGQDRGDIQGGRAGGRNPADSGQLSLFERRDPVLSTRVPTGVKAEEDPHKETLVADLDALKSAPPAPGGKTPLEKAADIISGYVNFKNLKGSPEEVVRGAVEEMVKNLLWLHDQMPEATRDRAKLWYDGARKIAERWAKQYGKTPQQVAGMMAVLSPQRDWFQNVSLAQRILDVMAHQQQHGWDFTMTRFLNDNEALKGMTKDIAAIKGKRLADVPDDPFLQALWLRAYDEVRHPRQFRAVTPEGNFGDYIANKGDGERTAAAWGSLEQIAKAISIFDDGSPRNILDNLGAAHKVRNFYNNIVAPNSPYPFVTIDTHAVAAALLRPLAGSDLEVSHNLGGGVSRAASGLTGTYPVYADAYEKAAEARDLLPREMQSITWEAVRGLFRPAFKAQKANKAAVDKIWQRYTQGEVALDDAQHQIHKLAGGIEPPAWLRRAGSSPQWTSSYTGELAPRGLPGRTAEGVDAGARERIAGKPAEIGTGGGLKKAAAPATFYSGGFLDPTLFKVLFPDLVQRLKDWSSESVTPAMEQREMMRETRGQRDRQVAAIAHKLDPVRKKWMLRPRADSIKFWNAVEQGKINTLDPKDQPLAKLFQSGFAPLIAEIQRLKPAALQNLIQNYFPHIWENPSLARKTLTSIMGGKRPFAGKASFLKERTIPTMADGLALGFKPVSWNPVELFMRKYAEMSQFIMGHQTLEMMKDAGTAKLVLVGSKPPDGWRQIDDKIGTVYAYDQDDHLFIMGHYYSPEGAAKIFNNYVSRGIAGRSAIYDVARWLNNNLNGLQLGISGFHAATTTVNAATSEVALGIEQLFQGKPVRATGHIVHGATILPAVLRSVRNGSHLLREYLDPGSYQKMSREASAVAEAGGRAKMDFTEIKPWRKMVNAFRNGSIAEGLWQIPGTILQTSIAPVMDYLVPRVKLGAFYDMAHNIFDQAARKGWDDETTRRQMQRAWDSIDNRFGQMVYENLFWHKALQDSLMLATRSVGWNFGDLRELGGAATDTLKQATKPFHAKWPEVTPRMAFAFALPLVTALIGGVLTYLWTGERPKTWKDYFYPRRKDGTRVSIPGYMKDVFAFYRDPVDTIVNKQGPLLEMTAEAIQNRDFYGNEIRHKDDPIVKQFLETAQWFGRTSEPFSFTGTKKLLEKEGEPTNTLSDVVKGALKHPGDVLTGQMGFQPAPSWVQNSAALNAARDYEASNFTPGTRTAAQAAKTTAMHQVSDMYRRKAVDKEAIERFKKDGTLNETDILKAQIRAREDPLYAATKSLHPDQVLKVYQAGTPEEQRTLRPLLEEKLMKITSDPQQQELRDQIRQTLYPKPRFTRPTV